MVNPGLSNHGLSDARRASLDPASVEYQLRVIGSKLHLTGWSLYTSILWCLKISVALFYNRLTHAFPPLLLSFPPSPTVLTVLTVVA